MTSPAEQTPAVSPAKRRRGLGLYAVSAALLIVALVLLILELIPANYYLFLPGEALPVSPMIQVKGYPPVKTGGRLLMTDVSLQKVDHLLEELYGRLNPDAELQPAQTVSGKLSPSQYQRFNVQLMNDSVKDAEAAALHVTRDYSAQCSRQGPVIADTQPGTPASRVLKPLDIVEKIDGHRIHCAHQVGPLIKRHKVTDPVSIVILRDGKLRSLTIRTVASPDTPSTHRHRVAIIGVYVQDRLYFPRFPVKISIRVGDIGGPSAGLMFALGIVGRLQHRDLTHGCTIAGTGTIDAYGNVGPIGGAKQKVIAARRAGAKYFLVPDTPDNFGPAMAARGDVTVVPIKTLQQALTYLQHIKPCR